MKKKKHENVKLKENVPRAILLREKPEECNISSSVPKQTYIFSIAGDVCLWYSIKYKTRGVPEVICAQRHKTNYMSPHNSRWLLDLSPPNNPINARALSLGTRRSLFSEVSRCNRMYILFTGRYIHTYFIGSSPQGFSESMLQ